MGNSDKGKGGRAASERGRGFKTEEVVPESGIYRVSHEGHRLPLEIMLLKEQRFPRCAKCVEPVTFETMYLMANLDRRGHVQVYELPELEQETGPDDEQVA